MSRYDRSPDSRRVAVDAPLGLGVITAACASEPPPPPQVPVVVAPEPPPEPACPVGTVKKDGKCRPEQVCLDEQDERERAAIASQSCVGRADCERACGEGRLRSCTDFGVMLQEGKHGAANLEMALTLFKKACVGGDGDACCKLGVAYEEGRGIEKDQARSVELYRQSCNCRSSLGCNDFAFAVEKGQGTGQDKARATGLYVRSCNLGSALGCKNAGVSATTAGPASRRACRARSSCTRAPATAISRAAATTSR